MLKTCVQTRVQNASMRTDRDMHVDMLMDMCVGIDMHAHLLMHVTCDIRTLIFCLSLFLAFCQDLFLVLANAFDASALPCCNGQ